MNIAKELQDRLGLAIISQDRKDMEFYSQLIEVLSHIFIQQSRQYFVCGDSGDRDENNLPTSISICPEYGADLSVFYERVKS